MKFAAVSAAYFGRESGCTAGFCDRGYNEKKIICVYIITDREVFQDTQTCRMIYDNGARYEDTDGSAEDLSRDDMVLVWGTCGAGQTTIQADQIQINRFVR